MPLTLCFIDTETTGLDPERHEVWEVAIVLRGPANDPQGPGDVEHVWQLPVDLARADLIALNIGHFHQRRHSHFLRAPAGPQREHGVVKVSAEPATVQTLEDWCQAFARLTWGAHLIGAIPSFDSERLERLLRRNGACPGWHYQPIDIEAIVAGWLRGQDNWSHNIDDLPWSSDRLSRLIGIDPAVYERHSALGDARWVRDQWDALLDERHRSPIPEDRRPDPDAARLAAVLRDLLGGLAMDLYVGGDPKARTAYATAVEVLDAYRTGAGL